LSLIGESKLTYIIVSICAEAKSESESAEL
jgi:hypothetical protein